jgi:hypothetical protein
MASSDDNTSSNDDAISLSMRTLNKECAAIPDWLEESDPYVDPVTTLYLAVFAVVVFMCLSRTLPIAKRAAREFFTRNVQASNEHKCLINVRKYYELPQTAQILIHEALLKKFPDMPATIGPPLGKLQAEKRLSSKVAPLTTGGDSVGPQQEQQRDLQQEPGQISNEWLDWFASTGDLPSDHAPQMLNALEFLSSGSFIAETEAMLRKRRPDMPPMLVPEEDDPTTSQKEANALTTPDDDAVAPITDRSSIAASRKSNYTTKKSLLLSSFGRLAASDPLAWCVSPPFFSWYSKQRASERDRFTKTLSVLVNNTAKEQHQMSDYEEATIVFALQLVAGLYVIFDYAAVQTWPSGNNWKCGWLYMTSIVVYKPFTIPMWYCLTICAQYSFTFLTFGGSKKGRVVGTGTPLGAPLPRTSLTMLMMGVTLCLHFVWLSIALPVATPLFVTFFPAVLLPAFMLPLLVVVAAKMIFGWMGNQQIHHFKVR